MPGDDLTNIEFPFRFKIVNAVPVTLVTVIVGATVLAGAPAHAPNRAVLLDNAREFGWAGAAAAVVLVVVLALVLEPLEVATVRFLEGYWARTGPMGRLAELGEWVQKRRHSRLVFLRTHAPDSRLRLQAARALTRYPPRADRMMPTALGNRLRAFEDRAGTGYNLTFILWWPRLHHTLPESVLGTVNQYRNQLDVAARLCIAFAVGAVISFVLLVRHPVWLWLPTAFVALAWFAYRGALGAAETYGLAATAAVDVYRLRLLQEMRVEIPQDTVAERRLNGQLRLLWRGARTANVSYSRTDSDHKIELS